MPKTAPLKSTKTAGKTAPPARKANTRARADRRVRKMHALEPAPTLRPTRDPAGLQKIARLMGGLSLQAANAYADARTAEGDKYARLSAAGYRESLLIFEAILKTGKPLTEREQEDLITMMNQIKLLDIRVRDYASASKSEAWRRENSSWNPHPLGDDREPVFARETY